ncbi:MAG: hypothetical protein AB1403_11310 [Candidatus Riflebacteria bacterium]
MSAKPFQITITPDPTLTQFAGRNGAALQFAVTNSDTRSITSCKINVVRADFMPAGSLPDDSDELKLAAGEGLINEGWVKARIADPDAWTTIDDWANGLELGAMAPDEQRTFEIKLEIPDVMQRQGKISFALQLAIK